MRLPARLGDWTRALAPFRMGKLRLPAETNV